VPTIRKAFLCFGFLFFEDPPASILLRPCFF
jgi:hypothetical protein